MTAIRNLLIASLLAICVASPTNASDPPDVTEAFQYVVNDTGDALEITTTMRPVGRRLVMTGRQAAPLPER